MENRKCIQCKRIFSWRACPSDKESGRGKYCSVGCKNETLWKHEKTFKCKRCGKVVNNKSGRVRYYCSLSCVAKGRKMSLELRNKLSQIKKGIRPKNFGVSFGAKGELNKNWKGGLTTENEKIRKSLKYKCFRCSVFERDKFTCQDCGVVGGKLQAHHNELFSKNKKLRFDINNGITLCFDCHSKRHPNMNMTMLPFKSKI